MSRRSLLFSAWLAVSVVVPTGIAVTGCNDEPTDVAPDSLPPTAVNPVLHAFLSKARSAHHRADLAEQSGERGDAIRALETITQGSKPALTPEVLEVIADTHARLADIRSVDGDFDGAAAEIDRGLEIATAPTHFQGHLFEMRGIVEQRRAEDLDAKGDKVRAADARKLAASAFEEAINVQERVIDLAIGGLPPMPPPAPSN